MASRCWKDSSREGQIHPRLERALVISLFRRLPVPPVLTACKRRSMPAALRRTLLPYASIYMNEIGSACNGLAQSFPHMPSARLAGRCTVRAFLSPSKPESKTCGLNGIRSGVSALTRRHPQEGTGTESADSVADCCLRFTMEQMEIRWSELETHYSTLRKFFSRRGHHPEPRPVCCLDKHLILQAQRLP